MMQGVRSILRETLPLLLFTATMEVLAGSFLGNLETSLERLPGLLAVVPAVLAMRGNISAAMGSRLGTKARFGVIPKDRIFVPVVWHNLVASLVLGVLLTLTAAGVAHLVTVRVGLESVGFLVLAAIAVSAGLVSGVLMGAVALIVMRVAFRRGYDLDNVSGPVLMTFGDVITVSALFLATRLAEAVL